MNTVNLQYHYYNAIAKQNLGSNINVFVLDAIRLKILKKTDTFYGLLKEGYQATVNEDSQIMNNYPCSDFEHCD